MMQNAIGIGLVLWDYYQLRSGGTRGGDVFVDRLLGHVLHPSVLRRINDPLENEPPLCNITALQRSIGQAAGRYYLERRPNDVDRERRAQTIGRIIAAQLTQGVVDAALREAANLQDQSDMERASFEAEERSTARHRQKPKAIYPV